MKERFRVIKNYQLEEVDGENQVVERYYIEEKIGESWHRFTGARDTLEQCEIYIKREFLRDTLPKDEVVKVY